MAVEPRLSPVASVVTEAPGATHVPPTIVSLVAIVVSPR
jgi:hypothetical protein